jgi:hypothetical protein
VTFARRARTERSFAVEKLMPPFHQFPLIILDQCQNPV